jgi:hypothetical protein
VTTANITGYNPNIMGTQTLTVTVKGKKAAFTVIVKQEAVITVNLDISVDVGRIEEVDGIAATLSRTGSGGAPASVTLTVAGTYVNYGWYLNGVYLTNGPECPLDTQDTLIEADKRLRMGVNYLTLRVSTAGGVYYARQIKIFVGI